SSAPARCNRINACLTSLRATAIVRKPSRSFPASSVSFISTEQRGPCGVQELQTCEGALHLAAAHALRGADAQRARVGLSWCPCPGDLRGDDVWLFAR